MRVAQQHGNAGIRAADDAERIAVERRAAGCNEGVGPRQIFRKIEWRLPPYLVPAGAAAERRGQARCPVFEAHRHQQAVAGCRSQSKCAQEDLTPHCNLVVAADAPGHRFVRAVRECHRRRNARQPCLFIREPARPAIPPCAGRECRVETAIRQCVDLPGRAPRCPCEKAGRRMSGLHLPHQFFPEGSRDLGEPLAAEALNARGDCFTQAVEPVGGDLRGDIRLSDAKTAHAMLPGQPARIREIVFLHPLFEPVRMGVGERCVLAHRTHVDVQQELELSAGTGRCERAEVARLRNHDMVEAQLHAPVEERVECRCIAWESRIEIVNPG